MAGNVKPVPEGYHTVIPYLVVRDAAHAIDFYERVFGAEETYRMEGPDGMIAHAEIRIGDSVVMISDEWPEGCCRSPESLGGTAVNITLYVDDVDAVFQRAVEAGAKVTRPLENMFWGDRYGQIEDPFGHSWGLSTHIEDVPEDVIRKRAQETMTGHVAL